MIPEEECTLKIDEATVCTVGANAEGVYVMFGSKSDMEAVIFNGREEITNLVDFLERRVKEII